MKCVENFALSYTFPAYMISEFLSSALSFNDENGIKFSLLKDNGVTWTIYLDIAKYGSPTKNSVTAQEVIHNNYYCYYAWLYY